MPVEPIGPKICKYCGRDGKEVLITRSHIPDRTFGGSDLPEMMEWSCVECSSINNKHGYTAMHSLRKHQEIKQKIVVTASSTLQFVAGSCVEPVVIKNIGNIANIRLHPEQHQASAIVQVLNSSTSVVISGTAPIIWYTILHMDTSTVAVTALAVQRVL